MNIKFYLVGGTVRDTLLEDTSSDIDYAVEAKSFKIMKDFLIDNNYSIYVEKEEFGCIKAKCPNSGQVGDYTLCRKDGYYSDFRRPDSIEPSDIYSDLSRRDFTINSIAQEVGSNELIDPHGGQKDLDLEIIRCVGDTHERLTEDPLRGLRALRFAVTKGFQIHPDILKVMKTDEFICNFKKLSKERVQVELMKMFKFNTVKSLQVLNNLIEENLLKEIFNQTPPIWLMPTLRK